MTRVVVRLRMTGLIDRYKQPEYTGENRCPPCTVVNVVLAALLAAAVGAVLPVAAVPVFAAALVTIYLRGYLVPKTPTLTKRYFPDRLLAKFDKAEDSIAPGASEPAATGAGESAGDPADPADASAVTVGAAGPTDAPEDGAVAEARAAADAEGLVDPETLLTAAGVVEECADEDDLCLADDYARAWLEAVAALRDDRAAQEAAATLVFDRDVEIVVGGKHGRPVVSAAGEDGTRLHVWVSEGAMVADLAAARVVADRTDWAAVLPAQRVAIAKALRSFMDTCPLCAGAVAMSEDTVESCCRSFDVLAVRCRDCGEHFLEIDPETMRETSSGRASVEG